MSVMLPIYLSQFAGTGISTLLGALSATFLIILLVTREALRTYNESLARRANTLDVLIYPLLFVFACIVVESFYRLIFT